LLNNVGNDTGEWLFVKFCDYPLPRLPLALKNAPAYSSVRGHFKTVMTEHIRLLLPEQIGHLTAKIERAPRIHPAGLPSLIPDDSFF
jgi:hypothetical protein